MKEVSQFSEVKLVYKSTPNHTAKKITCSADSYAALLPLFDEDTISYTEEFIVLFLNRTNKVIGWKSISKGGTAATIVDPKVVFTAALLANAHAIILSHNHPSGNLTPSSGDKEITNKLAAAGKALELRVFDHIIVGPDGGERNYLSFADEGLIIY